MAAPADRLTLAGPAEAELRERSSRFLAYAFPAADRDAIDQWLADVRRLHPEARHVCYAWRLGLDTYWADAGEPSGSAGPPILRRIMAAELDQVLVVVVRYFGGIKLGVPGLIAAYGQAAALALADAPRTVLVEYSVLKLQFAYEDIGAVELALRRAGAQALEHGFGAQVTLRLQVRTAGLNSLLEWLAPLSIEVTEA